MVRPSLDDTSALRVWRDQTLYRLLLRSSRVETSTTVERLQRLGYTDVTTSDTNLLANLDTAGTTISALARRAGVTRQAASQQVAALERAGYVQRTASPDDGRAFIVIQTGRGRALLNDALDIVDDLEAGYQQLLGEPALEALKEALSKLLAITDTTGTLGRD